MNMEEKDGKTVLGIDAEEMGAEINAEVLKACEVLVKLYKAGVYAGGGQELSDCGVEIEDEVTGEAYFISVKRNK